MEEQAAFKARQAERDAITDSKTAKNRAKRQKRKHGRKEPDGKEGSGDGGKGEKRKLAGGGTGVVFKRPSEEEERDSSGEEYAEDVGPILPTQVTMEAVETPKIAKEAEIVIHDD